MKLFKTHKKGVIASLAVAVAIFGGGAAFAYFTSNGTGTGTANVGTTAGVTISQVGPAYNSLIPAEAGVQDQYFQDQCFQCQGLSEFGNQVILTAAGTSGLLESANVDFRNWNAGFNNVPITLTFYTPGLTSGTVGAPIHL